MQNKVDSFLRAINNDSPKYNILTFPTHEAYQSNFASMPHTFYLFRGNGLKDWDSKYRKLPDNHVLLDGSQGQIKPDMKFDMVLSQNKFGQFQIADQIARSLNIPLISIEHTLPVPTWGPKQRQRVLNMRGKINVFISEFSIGEWGFDKTDPSVRIIHHGINTKQFSPAYALPVFEDPTNWVGHNDGKILTVVNDWINRDWCCGWNIYRRVSEGLPVNPVGATEGFSKAATSVEDLVNKYQNASVFLNTSTVSPVPTALMEAMACGCPIVTTATAMIPEIVEDGVNGFISNNEDYLREKLVWCLNNPDEAKKLGEAARQTILDRFSVDKHINNWMKVFEEVYGTGN